MRNTIYRKVLNSNIFGTHSAYIWVKEIREALKLKKKNQSIEDWKGLGQVGKKMSEMSEKIIRTK